MMQDAATRPTFIWTKGAEPALEDHRWANNRGAKHLKSCRCMPTPGIGMLQRSCPNRPNPAPGKRRDRSNEMVTDFRMGQTETSLPDWTMSALPRIPEMPTARSAAFFQPSAKSDRRVLIGCGLRRKIGGNPRRRFRHYREYASDVQWHTWLLDCLLKRRDRRGAGNIGLLLGHHAREADVA